MEFPSEVDSMKIEFLQRFIFTCKKNHIKLVFTISPAYSIVNEGDYCILDNIAKQEGITLLDYHSQKLFLDRPYLFHDREHLWDEGAQLFTSIFASDLKRLLIEE